MTPPTVAILTTGGTIAMRRDDEAGGAVPLLRAADFAAALPPGLATPEMDEIVNLPSSHFTVETLLEIRRHVLAALARPEVAGVVITHGTDVMEETAYLLDLTVPGEKPILLTGAMRTASQLGYDGYANLAAAVRVAVEPAARGLGAAIVFNDEVHAARWVTKGHTLSTATFISPGWGPIGRVEGDRVIIARRLPRAPLVSDRLEPRVALIKLAVGMTPDCLEDAVRRGVRGIVLEGLGGGRIPPWWLEPVRRAIEQGVAVVLASRCPGGRVWDAYGYPGAVRDWLAMGCLPAEGLNGQKARIKLMVVLGAAQSLDEVAALWKSTGACSPEGAGC